MKLIDKKRVLNRLGEIEDLTLELGCGTRKRHDNNTYQAYL
jgi:hypothetical protein